MPATRRRLLLAALAVPLLAACGFQLRGAQPLPFSSIHLGTGEFTELSSALKRQVEASGNAQVVSNPAEAEVRLEVLKDTRAREITSLNSAGKVREFELRRAFDFRLVDRSGAERIPRTSLLIKRTLTFSDTEVLAKEQEEALLYKEMDTDLVRQLIRRLAAAQPAR
ncbi:MAG: LPS assembly lipoprotein LptE [Rhodocyclaceae bacterium]|jgi:LPS-assembly lipoprotein|nr:LPS assembly lipoprotein LptE [Rhodocyclaceae bacterium]